MTMDQFFEQVLGAVKEFGGISWTLKIASIIHIVISSMKVSVFRPWWEFPGPWFQPFMSGALGFISGVLVLKVQNQFTWSGATAYAFSGAGAVVLHQMFDGIKLMPQIGPFYQSVIFFIEDNLGILARRDRIRITDKGSLS